MTSAASVKSDFHEARLNAMTKAGDWSGLVRDWLAVQHLPSLQRALQILHEKAERDGDAWRELLEVVGGFAVDPIHRTFPVLTGIKPLCSQEELITLDLLKGYSWMLFCETAPSAAAEMQGPMLELGVATALRNANLAAGMGDLAVAGACGTQLILGMTNQGRYAECLPHAVRVVELYETLAGHRPELFMHLQARSLLNLTKVHMALGQPHEAKSTALKCVRCARQAASWNSGQVDRILALAWNNLALTWGSLGRPATAACCMRQAVARERKLHKRDPISSPISLARALCNSADLARKLQSLDEAKALANEAVELLRRAGPPSDGPLAFALRTLAAVCESPAELGDAEACCREALKIRERLGDASSLGDTHLDLADILSRQQRFGEALAAVDTALRLYQSLPEARASFRNARLAIAWNRRAIPLQMTGAFEDGRESLGRAVTIQRSLTEQDPEQAATLANMLSNRSQSHREFADYEAALRDADEAVRIFAALPQGIRAAQKASEINALANLGAVCADLAQYVRAQDAFTEAIRQHRALKSLPPKFAYPERARLLSNLGEAERSLGNLTAARQYLTESFDLLRSDELREAQDWTGLANTLTNLANVQLDDGDFSGAVSSYHEALDMQERLARENPDFHRRAIARLHGNLGSCWMRQSNRSRSIHHYEIARSLFREEAGRNPHFGLANRMHVLLGLATVLSQTGSAQDPSPALAALDVLREAQEVAASYRGHFIRPEERQRVQRDALAIFGLAIINGVCLATTVDESWPLEEAVEASEAARSRQLADLLASQDVEPIHTPNEVLSRFREARKRLRSLTFMLARREADALPDPKSQQVQALARQQRAEYEAIVAKIRHCYDPEFDPDAPAPRMRFAEIQALVPNDLPTAFVQFSTLMPNSGVALVVSRNDVKSVLLPGLTEVGLHDLASRWRQTVPRTSEAKAWQKWESEVGQILDALARIALWPLLPLLTQNAIRRLVVCPHRELHLFPLSAGPLPDGRPLVEFNGGCEVIMTPSFALLKRCARQGLPGSQSVLLVENPTGDLESAAVEGAVVRELYQPTVTVPGQRDALKSSILRLAPECAVFHYAGHADFDSQRPFDACLRLGNLPTEHLTLREIFGSLDLRQCNLAILSGCETSASVPDSTDDQVSLATGFLHAGARCVLASLWSADDLATALLMARFHRNWRSGLMPAAALSEAQDWLRKGIANGHQLQVEVDALIALIARQLALADPSQAEEIVMGCRDYGAALAAQYPNQPPFASPAHWAAFGSVGLGFRAGPLLSAAAPESTQHHFDGSETRERNTWTLQPIV